SPMASPPWRPPVARPLRQRIRSALHVWTRLLPYLRPHRRQLFFAGLLTLVIVAVEVLKPWPIKVVIDQVLLGNDWALLPDAWNGETGKLLWLAVAATIVLAAVGGIANFFREVWLADAGQRAVGKVRLAALESVMRQSLTFYERHRAGDLLVRLSGDAMSLRMLLVEGLFALGREGLLVSGTLAVMALLDWRLALAATAVLPVIAVLLALFSVRLRAAARKQRRKEGELAASAHETLAAVPVVQTYGLEQVAAGSFAKQNRRSARAGLKATRLEGHLGMTSDIALALGTAFVLWLGVGRVQAGILDPGELLVMLSYARSFYRPIRKGLGRSAAMVKAGAAGERVLELLDATPDLVAPKDPVRMPAVRGEVEFRGVHFRHADGRDVLRGVDLHLRPGSHIALVGGNGAGKTTLATLLPRLREPTDGSVLLDGVDIRRFDPVELRGHLAYVFQETILFDGTLRENVQFGGLDASDADVAAAADLAGVTAFAERLPHGLDTRVGERGAELSGGERQRIALARALLRDAAVFVFDEPTTGLDFLAEANLCDRVLAHLRGRTVIVITHNPRVLAAVDAVVRLQDGRVATVDGGRVLREMTPGGIA
ncbi:MAG: ABC transporter ATP-binding protein, partial [Planctomycetes bacterium]|nr:ABC transporter ATP-binding protein [Planctomycetota bacterium]